MNRSHISPQLDELLRVARRHERTEIRARHLADQMFWKLSSEPFALCLDMDEGLSRICRDLKAARREKSRQTQRIEFRYFRRGELVRRHRKLVAPGALEHIARYGLLLNKSDAAEVVNAKSRRVLLQIEW